MVSNRKNAMDILPFSTIMKNRNWWLTLLSVISLCSCDLQQYFSWLFFFCRMTEQSHTDGLRTSTVIYVLNGWKSSYYGLQWRWHITDHFICNLPIFFYKEMYKQGNVLWLCILSEGFNITYFFKCNITLNIHNVQLILYVNTKYRSLCKATNLQKASELSKNKKIEMNK